MAESESKWELSVDPKRDPITKRVLHITITAKWNGIRRYQATFQADTRKKNWVKRPYNTHRFNEDGNLAESNITIPSNLRIQMIIRAKAIIFEKRQNLTRLS